MILLSSSFSPPPTPPAPNPIVDTQIIPVANVQIITKTHINI